MKKKSRHVNPFDGAARRESALLNDVVGSHPTAIERFLDQHGVWLMAAMVYFAILIVEMIVVAWNGEIAFQFGITRDIYLILVLIVAGAVRGWSHPINDRNYLRWLDATPWTGRQSLPFGHRYLFGWRELLLVSLVMVGDSGTVFPSPWYYPALLITCYIMTTLHVLKYADMTKHPLYIVTALTTSLLSFYRYPMMLSGAILLLYFAMAYLLRQTTHRIIWQDIGVPQGELRISEELDFRRQSARPPRIARTQFSPVSPDTIKTGMSWLDQIGFALSFTTIFGALSILIQRETSEDKGGWFVIVIAAGLIALYLLAELLKDKSAPISLWGRIRIGKLLIPNFDRVYFYPLSMLLIGWGILLTLFLIKVNSAIAGSISMAAVILLLMRALNEKQSWDLTGHFHISMTQSSLTSKRV